MAHLLDWRSIEERDELACDLVTYLLKNVGLVRPSDAATDVAAARGWPVIFPPLLEKKSEAAGFAAHHHLVAQLGHRREVQSSLSPVVAEKRGEWSVRGSAKPPLKLEPRWCVHNE
jgi:hypothetical protein